MFFGKTAREIGANGEKIAAKLLKKQGYKIVAKNFHSAHGEIDIIAENKDFLVFAEVKARRDSTKNFENYGLPGEAVNKHKQQHIIYTADIYLNSHPTDKAIRFDVIEIFLGEKIRTNHIEDAFRL